MFPATVICTLLLAIVLASSSLAVIREDGEAMAMLERVGAVRLAPVVSAAGLVGAGGLVLGLAIAPLGIAAAGATIAYMGGALGAHLRARDARVQPALVIGLLAAATLALRVLTA